MLLRPVLTCLILLALTLPAAAQLSLWTVNPAGGADFTALQAAVDAASAGDVILLEGTVQETVVVNKGLTIVGSGIQRPSGSNEPVLRISNLPADESMVLADMAISLNGGSAATPGVQVENCAGSVWLQDVFVDSFGGPCLTAHATDSLVIVGGVYRANLAPALADGTPQHAPGVRITGNSRLFGYDSNFGGSHGSSVAPGSAPLITAAAGGAALILEDSAGMLYTCSLSGGAGDTVDVGSCMEGGDGGAGVVLRTTTGPGQGQLTTFGAGSSIAGGTSGFADANCMSAPSPGPTVDAGSGTSFSLAGPTALPLRRLNVPSLVSPGGLLPLTIQGSPGDMAFLLVAGAPGPDVPLNSSHFLHLAPSSLTAVLGLPLPMGFIDSLVTMPNLPAGVEGIALRLQVVFVDNAGIKHTSAPRSLASR